MNGLDDLTKLAKSDLAADIASLIEKAKQDWMLAQSLFDNVVEPEMVDHAIHLIVAAEKKYTYLLRLAKSDHEPDGPVMPR